MPVTIRDAVSTDSAAIADFHVRSWKDTYAELLPEEFFTAEFTQERHDMWRHELGERRPEAIIKLAESEHEIVGFVWCVSSKDAAARHELCALYVASAFHGTGVAQRLLDDALPPGASELWVAEANPRAIAFYRRNGFASDGERREPPSFPAMAAVRMVRSAPAA